MPCQRCPVSIGLTAAGQSCSRWLLDHPTVRIMVSGHTYSGKSEDESCNVNSAGLFEPSPPGITTSFCWGRTLVIAVWSITRSAWYSQSFLNWTKSRFHDEEGFQNHLLWKRGRTWGAQQWKTKFTDFIDEKEIQDLQKPEGPTCLNDCCRLWNLEPKEISPSSFQSFSRALRQIWHKNNTAPIF